MYRERDDIVTLRYYLFYVFIDPSVVFSYLRVYPCIDVFFYPYIEMLPMELLTRQSKP